MIRFYERLYLLIERVKSNRYTLHEIMIGKEQEDYFNYHMLKQIIPEEIKEIEKSLFK